MQEYDLVVVGSGSGLDVASVAAQSGRSVAVIEAGPLGGTCLNRGCIPSKMLLYHAHVMATIRRADEFGIAASVDDVDFAGIVREVTEDVDGDSRSIERGLDSSSRHDLYRGAGRFVDDRTFEVDGYDERLRGEQVLLATGSRPSVPPIEGLDDVDYLTSTEALRLEDRPDRLVIVGGGYIAAELGTFFGAFGTDVTVIGRRPRLLPETDPEVGAAFTDVFREGHTVHVGYEAVAVSESGGTVTVTARAVDDSGAGGDGGDGTDEVTATGDALLVATGRVPNADALDVAAGGVELDADGSVAVDESLRTSADGVWALGDVVGEYMLKHSANYEAEVVVRNMLAGDEVAVDYTAMPYAVFASPEVAGVGATTADLDAAGASYATNTYAYRNVARGSAMKADGFAKAIVDPDDGRILGTHVVGPDASTLIHEVVVAMAAGTGTVEDVRSTVHVHPALNEVVQRAFAGRFRPSGGGREHGHGREHDR